MINVINDFADPALCREIVQKCANWRIPEKTGDRCFRELRPNHPDYKTPHVFQIYNFNRFEDVEFGDLLKQIFLPMYQAWKDIAGNPPIPDNIMFRPQIIHYPRGGGFFGKHEHSLNPQKVGLILSLTDRGVEYTDGETEFYPGGELKTVPQPIGSLTTFKYDIPHAVSKCDPEADLEFFRPTGRWTAILPLF